MTPRATLQLVAAAAFVGTGWLVARRQALAGELFTIAAAREATIAATGDARLTTEIDRIRLALEQARSKPARAAEAHLALALGDDLLTLERGDIVLRSTTVRADVPRGMHPIAAVEAEAIVLEGGIRLVPLAAGDRMASAVIGVPRTDFDAIRPNVRVGQMAYFF